MGGIRIGIVGVGNCASSLIQGIHYYRDKSREDSIGLMHWDIGGYKPHDIQIASAFDIDRRKVGKDLAEAIFAQPNCRQIIDRLRFHDHPDLPAGLDRIALVYAIEGSSHVLQGSDSFHVGIQ